MSDWRSFVTDNYTFDKDKGYVLDVNRPTPKFLQKLNRGINKTFKTFRTSNPFNLTQPSVARTGTTLPVTGGSSDNRSSYENIKVTDGGSLLNKIKNISTSPAVTGSSYSIATGKQMQGTLGIADLMLGPLAGPAKLLSGLTKSHLETITARAALGDEGFAIGEYDGRPVGLSKGLLGYQLTGVFPQDQRKNIINDLLKLSQQGKGSGFLGQEYTKFGMGDAGFDKEFTTSINKSGLSDAIKKRLLDTSTKIKTSDQYVKETNETGTVSSGKSFDTFKSEKEKTREGAEGFTGDFGFNEGGFIGGPPSQYSPQKTVADDVNFDAREGGFVINAPAVQKFGEEKLNAMYSSAKNQNKSPSLAMGGEIPIKISKGEMYIPPEHVNAMGGMEFLKKINNQGKPVVTAIDQGFAQGYKKGDEIDLPATRPSSGLLELYDAIKETFPGGSKEARKTTKNFLNKMSDEEALALTAITEASILGEKGLESVMHVVNNRINSDYADFKRQFNVKDVLNRQTAGGAFQFTGLEIKSDKDYADLRTHVNNLVNNPKAYRNYMKNVDMAREVLQGKRKDFTGGALFYYNPEASTSKDFKNKVANRTYIPIYSMKGGGSRHIYFSPQEIYRPENPVSRPQTPAQKVQKKFAQQNFLNEEVDLSKKGMFGTFLANRPSLQVN